MANGPIRPKGKSYKMVHPTFMEVIFNRVGVTVIINQSPIQCQAGCSVYNINGKR